MLVESAEVPVYISSYGSEKINRHTKPLRCCLNFVNCVDTAAVGEKTISGKTESGQLFRIKPIVQSEFALMARENFILAEDASQRQTENPERGKVSVKGHRSNSANLVTSKSELPDRRPVSTHNKQTEAPKLESIKPVPEKKAISA